MKNLILLSVILISSLNHSTAFGKMERKAQRRGLRYIIVSPKNNATVGKKFKVVFGLSGMGVACWYQSGKYWTSSLANRR